MNEKRESKRSGRTFLQPLAVALVSLVLASLSLTMGLMNLKALDQTLLGYLEGRGRRILRDLQQVAEVYYSELTQTSPAFFDPLTGTPRPENAFSLQEAFLNDTVHWARGIDRRRAAGDLPDDQMPQLAKMEGLRLIAFLGKSGYAVSKNRPIPREISTFISPVVEGKEAIKTNFFNRPEAGPQMGLIALRRDDEKGTLILALKDEGFQSRCSRFSIDRAIDEVAEDPDILYLTLVDRRSDRSAPTERTLKDNDRNIQEEVQSPELSDPHASRIRTGNEDVLEIILPFRMGGELKETVKLGLSAEIEGRLLTKNRNSILLSMGFMVFITLLAMWLLYKNQNRHLARMREVERRLQRAERLSALGSLAAGIAHEVRNPLNAISMAAQRLQRENPHQLTLVIRDEINRLNHIIEEFLSISRTSRTPIKRHELGPVLQQMVLLLEEEAASKGINIEADWTDPRLAVAMDPDKMKQALFNIIKNAMESLSEGGIIRVTLSQRGRDSACIGITDSGRGIPAGEINRIFDPHYTTKEKGLGLGLPIAHEIIRGFAGEIQVSSRLGVGTTFEILLPLDSR